RLMAMRTRLPSTSGCSRRPSLPEVNSTRFRRPISRRLSRTRAESSSECPTRSATIPAMDIASATRGYEDWLGSVLPAPVARPDLDYKHERMADPNDPFPFFRGTYYRWAQLWAEAAGPLATAPRVVAIGDLHPENFGTWRDVDGRLCWGVNDFDEADELPYTNDLVRLAASARLAREAGILPLKLPAACASILDGYAGCLAAGGRPFVLEGRHPHLP